MPPKKSLNLNQCIIQNNLPGIACITRGKKSIILRDIHIRNIIKYNRTKLLKMLCDVQIHMIDINEKHIIDHLLSTRQYEILIIMLKNKLFTFVDIIYSREFIQNMILGSSLEVGKSDHVGLHNMESILLSDEYAVMEALTANYRVVVSKCLIEHLLIANHYIHSRIFHILNRIKIIDESSLFELYLSYPPGSTPISVRTIPCISFVQYFHEKKNQYRDLYDMTKCSIELILLLNRLFKKYDNALIDMHVFAFTIRDFLYKHI